jgi:hypothetical protein
MICFLWLLVRFIYIHISSLYSFLVSWHLCIAVCVDCSDCSVAWIITNSIVLLTTSNSYVCVRYISFIVVMIVFSNSIFLCGFRTLLLFSSLLRSCYFIMDCRSSLYIYLFMLFVRSLLQALVVVTTIITHSNTTSRQHHNP